MFAVRAIFSGIHLLISKSITSYPLRNVDVDCILLVLWTSRILLIVQFECGWPENLCLAYTFIAMPTVDKKFPLLVYSALFAWPIDTWSVCSGP